MIAPTPAWYRARAALPEAIVPQPTTLTDDTRLGRSLTPEEDAIGDPDDEGDEIDDLLPADLWF